LLVLDNVDDPKLVAPYLPSTDRGAILMTTRNTSPLFTAAAESQIIDPLSTEESVALFMSQLALDQSMAERTAEDKDTVYEICEELGGLPLAVTQVAGFIINASCSLGEVVNMFKSISDANYLFEGQGEPIDAYYELTLSNVWNVTFSRLSQPTRDLLDIIAFLDPDSIPERLFKAAPGLCAKNPELKFLNIKAQ
jgi:hypothetical protein